MKENRNAPEGVGRSSALGPNTPAPDFKLHSTPDQLVTLSDFRGQPVILAFYPADWSPGVRRSDGAIQRGPAGVPALQRGADGHIGRWRVVPHRVRQGSQAPVSPAGGR